MSEQSTAIITWQTLRKEDPQEGLTLLRELLDTMPPQFALPTEGDGNELDADSLYLWLQNKLAAAISRLLDRDMNRFLQILYRIDVSESKVNEAFQGDVAGLPIRLAQLIIERQLQKVFTRREHAKHSAQLPSG